MTGPEPAALESGTSIEVHDLYFNTPARRKFLKTEATEFAHCDEAFKRIALARHDVAFKLVHNGRAQWHLPAHDRHARIAAILGEEFGKDAIAVDAQSGSLRLSGLIGSPAAARGTRDAQYFMVNGRFVRDKVLAHALRQAYQEVFDQQMEEVRLRDLLQRIQHSRIVITFPQKLTPFCFPIKVDSLREDLSSEKLEDRVKKMQWQLEDR